MEKRRTRETGKTVIKLDSLGSPGGGGGGRKPLLSFFVFQGRNIERIKKERGGKFRLEKRVHSRLAGRKKIAVNKKGEEKDGRQPKKKKGHKKAARTFRALLLAWI